MENSRQNRKSTVCAAAAVLAAAVFLVGFAVWLYPLRQPDYAVGSEDIFLEDEAALLDLNTADFTSLCRLDGIGESRARAILQWREQNGPFTSVQQLLEVPGITEAALKIIGPQVKALPPT